MIASPINVRMDQPAWMVSINIPACVKKDLQGNSAKLVTFDFIIVQSMYSSFLIGYLTDKVVITVIH